LIAAAIYAFTLFFIAADIAADEPPFSLTFAAAIIDYFHYAIFIAAFISPLAPFASLLMIASPFRFRRCRHYFRFRHC
jgi:hypothetical protein